MLSVGKAYTTRSGKAVVITAYNPEYDEDAQPWLGDNGWYYDKDGFVFPEDNVKFHTDIMDPESNAPPPDIIHEEDWVEAASAERIAALEERVEKLEEIAKVFTDVQEFMEQLDLTKFLNLQGFTK